MGISWRRHYAGMGLADDGSRYLLYPSSRRVVPPLPQSVVGFPDIPGVTYTGLKTTRYRLDYGPDYYTTGVATINPPLFTPPYQDNALNGPILPLSCPRPTATATKSPACACPT